MNPRIDKQGGWVGMIAVLIALAVVAYLSKDAFKKYLAVPDAETTLKRAGTPAEPGRAPAGASSAGDPTGVAPAPASALDRARGLQETLQKESEKRGGQY